MPLRCIGPDGQSIQSFDLPEAEWSALRLENRRSQQLRMPCCDASVVMKTSTRGQKFFAHKSRGPCQSAPEIEGHLALKMLAAQAARRAGWTCSTEASGSSPSGEKWTADVLAHKGEAKVAIEIQWSPQTNEESLYRQERYRPSGVRCLWLFRRSGFPTSKDFPSARVSGDVTAGFKAHLGRQEMPVDEFLDAVFAKRFRYGIPLGAKAIVRIRGTLVGLEELTPMVMFIDVSVGTHRFCFRGHDLNDFPDLLASCDGRRISKALNIRRINPRYSRRDAHRTLSIEDAPLTEFQTTICERWVKAIEATHHPDIYGWRVVAFE
jgi:hypothetical protein